MEHYNHFLKVAVPQSLKDLGFLDRSYANDDLPCSALELPHGECIVVYVNSDSRAAGIPKYSVYLFEMVLIYEGDLELEMIAAIQKALEL